MYEKSENTGYSRPIHAYVYLHFGFTVPDYSNLFSHNSSYFLKF